MCSEVLIKRIACVKFIDMNEPDFASDVEEFSAENIYIDDDIFEVIENLLDRVELENHSIADDYCTSYSSKSVNDVSVSVNCATDSSIDRSKQRYGSRKTRIRQRKHKWKPYVKLTGDERRRLDERNTRRAEAQHRERMELYGLPLAPFNTTQYLMEEHERDNIKSSKSRDDYNSSEDFYSSPDDEMEFIQKQFSEVYDTCHESYINNLNKTELVRELMRLEDEIESLEQRLGTGMFGNSLYDYSAEFKKIEVFQNEIEKLSVENHILEQRNQMLQKQVSELNAG